MLAGEALDQLEKLFSAAHADAGRPIEMAAFIRHESEGRLHCVVKVYFSPESAAVARQVDAEACARPSPDGLGLLAGAEESWLTLFPERRR